MANPITWRSVQGASLAEASRPLALAQLGINQGFDKLGQMIAERQAVNQGAVDRTDEANVQSYLDTVGKAQTPEEVAALRASGQLDALRQTINPKDLARVRGADEARLASLFTQTKAKNEFSDSEVKRQYSGIRDTALGLAAQGDRAGALAILEANPNMPDAAEIYKAAIGGERDMARFQWQGQENASKIQNDIAQRNVSNANATAANESALTNRLKRATMEEEAEANKQRNAYNVAMEGNRYQEGILTPATAAALINEARDMKLTGTGDDAPIKLAKFSEKLMELANTGIVRKDPNGNDVTLPYSISDARAAMLSMTNNLLSWNEGYADNFVEKLRKTVPGVKAETADPTSVFRKLLGKTPARPTPIAVDPLVEDYLAYKAINRGKADLPAAKSKK